jgi:hypothetical protein
VTPLVERNQVSIVGRDKLVRPTQVRAISESAPFGPALLEVPPEIQTPGLRVDARRLAPGEVMQVAIAAGEGTGISSGPIRKHEKAVHVAPIGVVSGLVALACYVRPGSCGGPVVDRTLAVRGFIVAGTDDPDEPYSLADPSSRWIKFVRANGGQKPRSDARPRRGRAKSPARRKVIRKRKA